MKKEIIIAIVFGVALGLLVAFILVLRIRDIESKKAFQVQTPQQTAKSKAKFNSSQELELLSPDPEQIVTEQSIIVKGKADKNALIVVQTPIKDSVFTNTQTDFSVKIPLALGENVISISMYPRDKQLRSQHKSLKVYYLDEE